MLSRNYYNEVTVHRSMQIIWVYIRIIICSYSSLSRQKLRLGGRSANSFTSNRLVFAEEINIKVQNEEISMIWPIIWGSKNDFRAWRPVSEDGGGNVRAH